MRRAGWLAACAAVVALAGVGGVMAATAGGSDPDPTDTPASASASGAARPKSSSAEAGFARDMAVHHQQAVEMSFVIRDRTDNEEIRRLAYDIANTQANQRGMLLGWLDLWDLPKVTDEPPMAWMGMKHEPGHDGALMPGMATKKQLDQLAKAEGKQAEILYLRLMTDHHKGGVHMARGCAERCEVDVERRLAEGMVTAQQSEMKLMADLLKKRGAEAR